MNIFNSRQEANNFNLHFASVASKIIGDNNNASNVDLSKLKSFVEIKKPPSVEFTIPLLSENLLMHYINSLPIKVATGLDNISVPLLKLIAPYVSESLTKVLNCSLQSGICQDVLKIARITPIHKNGSKSDPTNYR